MKIKPKVIGRKEWGFNPKTRVKPNKKAKLNKKASDKDAFYDKLRRIYDNILMVLPGYIYLDNCITSIIRE